MLLGTSGARLLGDILVGKGMISAGKGFLRAGYRSSIKNKDLHPLADFEIQKY